MADIYWKGKNITDKIFLVNDNNESVPLNIIGEKEGQVQIFTNGEKNYTVKYINSEIATSIVLGKLKNGE